MIKEKAYKYKNYQISYDEGLKDRSALVIGIKEKDTLYITGELYDESANAVIKILNSKDQEIERLNNIIKELEKWVVESIEKYTEDYLDWKYDRNVYLAGSKKLQNVLDKLQELKVGDKE